MKDFFFCQLVKSLPFHIPEAWERYPFRAEPLRLGHHRKNPPPPPPTPRAQFQPVFYSCLEVQYEEFHKMLMVMDHFHEAVFWITVSFFAFVVGVHSFLSFLYKNQVIILCWNCAFMSRELILSCLCVESLLITWKCVHQNLTMAV